MIQQTGKKATVACPFCATLNRVDLGRISDQPKCGECKRPILLDRPVRVTDNDFQRVISDTEVPVLVDFYADWCGPCKIMAPSLDEIARTRAGELLVAKLDTDRNPSIATTYAIRSLPTLVLFRDGREVKREIGALPKQRIEAMLL